MVIFVILVIGMLVRVGYMIKISLGCIVKFRFRYWGEIIEIVIKKKG